MTENEKRGFQNGCYFMLRMMCRIKEKLKERGEDRLANCFCAFIEAELEEIGIATEFYAVFGEKMCDLSEGEKIFIDRQCPTCHGRGCEECHGTGTVGSCEESSQSVQTPVPTEFGDALRAWRLKHGRTFRELGAETGILPSVLSEIEIGRREPTEEQRRRIKEIMR